MPDETRFELLERLNLMREQIERRIVVFAAEVRRLNAEIDRLKTERWIAEVPSEEGFYWWQPSKWQPPRVVRFLIDRDLDLWCWDDSDGTHYLTDTPVGRWWPVRIVTPMPLFDWDRKGGTDAI